MTVVVFMIFIALSLLFSTYVMAGGLIAAAYTDFLQGTMLIVLSVMLVPAGLHVIGGMPELQHRLAPGGNFIKRFLTIAWAFTGLIALVLFPRALEGLDLSTRAGVDASETLFGQAIQHLLGDGWRGLMIACIMQGHVPDK